TSELAAPLFATSSSDQSIINSFYVNGRLLIVAGLVINPESKLVGMPVRELGQGHHVFVLTHVRGGESNFFPPGDLVFQAGDRITVQTQPQVLKELHRLNRDPEPF